MVWGTEVSKAREPMIRYETSRGRNAGRNRAARSQKECEPLVRLISRLSQSAGEFLG